MNTIKPLHLRGAEVDTLIGIGKTTRFSWQDPKSPYYDPTWPLPIRLGTRKTVYIADDVEAWLKVRPRTREIHNESSMGVYTEQHFETRNRIATGVTK